MKLFEKDFEQRKKNSIFEFSVISLVIQERKDFQVFEKERNNCQNRVDKILYHGTSIEFINDENKIVKPIPWILTGHFKNFLNHVSMDKAYILPTLWIIVGFMAVKLIDVMEMLSQKLMIHSH